MIDACNLTSMNWPSADFELFLLIHTQWVAEFADRVMPHYREKSTWIPLYLFLIYWILKKYRRTGFLLGSLGGLSVGLADHTSSKIIKPAVGRLRPCRTPELIAEIRELINCGPGLSFPSSHAANHFALAVFLFVLFRRRYPVAAWAGLIWALSIGYAQIYVGLHFPMDVVAGSVLGALIGWGLSQFFLWLRPGWRTPHPGLSYR